MTTKVADVAATINQALAASGLDRANVVHRPRLLSDNGSSYIATDLAHWLEGQGIKHARGAPYHPMTAGQDRALAPGDEEPHRARKLLPASRRSRGPHSHLRRSLQLRPLPREPEQPAPRPMSTPVAANQSCSEERSSNAKPSNTAACSTKMQPPKLTPQMGQGLHCQPAPPVSKS